MFYAANEQHITINIDGVEDSEGTQLQVLAFDGIEGINSEYVFEITLVSKHLRYDITKLLSKTACLSFTPDNKNIIHGIIPFVKRGAIGKDYALFKVLLVPRFYHLNNETDQRAFINKSVPEIITSVLSDKGYQQGDNMDFVFKLKEDYPKREFCCQYDESTAAFVYRLCEEEGLNIHYQHAKNNHCMVFSDDNNYFPNLENKYTYASDTGFVADHPVFKRFDVNLNTSTTEASYRNYNFTNMKIPEGSANLAIHKKGKEASEPSLEYYDYPQQHLNKARGDHYAKIQIQRLKTYHLTGEAYTDIPELKSGYAFEVEGYYPLEKMDTSEKWLAVQIYHQGRQPQVIEALGSENSAILQEPSYLFKYYKHPIDESLYFPFDEFKQGYRNVLLSVPKNSPFRPQKLHPKQQVLGSQTAIVTGAAGEEIYCDEYGRIKILFHWDRINPQNENSSHWIRVASNWAHDGYGTVVIPRVGMEVKVDFLGGDIDNPIVTGAIHNGVNKVPYDLPANKTRSVFKTSSSKDGVGSNELRIEDKAGQEQIFVQAQKDFDQLTKNNHTVQVNNNSHLQVNNEYSETIKANRYTKNEAEEHHLTDLDRKTQVMMNDYKEVSISEHTTVGTIYTTEAGMEIHLKSGMQTVIDGGLSLTLKAGGQHIVLNPAGIWMTMPVWTGGVPMEGTPALPLPPLAKENAVAATVAPSIIYKNGVKQLAKKQTGNYRGVLDLIDQDKKPIPNTWYKIVTPQGNILAEGITDQQGKSIEVATDEGPTATLYLGKGDWELTEEIISQGGEPCCGCDSDDQRYMGVLNLIDQNNNPIADSYYKILDDMGEILAEGVTNDRGESIEVTSYSSDQATLILGQSDWAITEEIIADQNGSTCGCE